MPAKYNLSVYRGDTKRFQLRLWSDTANSVPYDLSDATPLSQIRDKIDGTVMGAIECVITLPNIIDCVLVADDSSNLPAKGVWDLQLTFSSGDVMSPIAGSVAVTFDVTKPTSP